MTYEARRRGGRADPRAPFRAGRTDSRNRGDRPLRRGRGAPATSVAAEAGAVVILSERRLRCEPHLGRSAPSPTAAWMMTIEEPAAS